MSNNGEPSDPKIHNYIYSYVFDFGSIGYSVKVSSIRDNGDTFKVDLEIYKLGNPTEHVHQEMGTNLGAGRTVAGVVKELAILTPIEEETWRWNFRLIVKMAVQLYRTGKEIQLADTMHPNDDIQYLVKPLLTENDLTIIASPGGVGKSWLAQWLAIAFATGEHLPLGLTPLHAGPVLYLNYEAAEGEWKRRDLWLRNGLGADIIPGFYHRWCERPLDVDIDYVRENIMRLNIQLVILDSITMATGGDIKDNEDATRILRALNTLPCTKLALGHVTKAEHTSDQGQSLVLGAIQFTNQARNNFFLRASRINLAESHIAVYGGKTNYIELDKPLVLHRTIDNASKIAGFKAAVLSDAPILRRFIPLTDQLREILLKTPNMTPSELAVVTGKDTSVVRTTLNNMTDTTQTHKGQGRGDESEWALRTLQ